MVAPVLIDYTYQYTDTGVVLNTDASLTPFLDVLKISGLDSAPARLSTKDTEGMDGGIVEADYETIRTVVVEGTLYGTTEAFLDTLKTNFAISTVALPFYFKSPGTPQRVLFAKSIGLRYDVEQVRALSITNFQVQLLAGDPILYASTLSTSVVNVSAPITTGRGYNRLYPLSYGGTITSGIFFITNAGTRPVGATMVITGPVVNPIVVSDTEGKSIQVLISLAVGETLTIDLAGKSIILNGTANRRNLMTATSKWFKLQPGANQLRFNATTTTSSQITVSWRDGWR